MQNLALALRLALTNNPDHLPNVIVTHIQNKYPVFINTYASINRITTRSLASTVQRLT